MVLAIGVARAVDGSIGNRREVVTNTTTLDGRPNVGEWHTGELAVVGGDLTVSGNAFIGRYPTAIGTVAVTGLESRFTLLTAFNVGYEGTGWLIVSNVTQVTAGLTMSLHSLDPGHHNAAK
ncbi:hypothetical protein [Microvirga guangxiensis]|uniref:T5SS/PEP-CTERM-associated repeat-containing protein n=1 Tax=Microvirga guangxiensis TaxID=549386 RepID=A0A1G5LLX2_9HYPH|nr:T5SS/PEP-CTERM-associated repeat-containing protein [Microvirga guangxiensis]